MDVFFNLFSDNEQLREIGHETIMKKAENPNFIFELFNILESHVGHAADDTLLKSVSIVIHKILQSYWFADFYFDDSQRITIFRQLLKLLFLLPFNVRPILEVSFVEFNLPLSMFTEAISLCFNQIQSNSLENISTSINIMNYYFKNTKISDNFIEFVEILIPHIFQFVEDLRNGKRGNDLLSIILSNICDLFQFFTLVPQSILTFPNFMEVLSSILTTFSFVNSSTKLKLSICDLMLHFLEKIEIDPQILSFFSSAILEFLKTTTSESFLYAKCFSVINLIMSKYHIFDEFINSSTIQEIFIPHSILTADDLSTFREIPEQFLAFCYGLEENEITPRIAISSIFKTIRQEFNEQVDNLLLFFLEKVSQDLNPMKFEATLFMISCLISSRPYNIDVYQLSLTIINGSFHPCVISTAVFILQNMKIDHVNLNKLSLHLLISFPYDVIKILSIYLFKKTFKPPNTRIEVPFSDILTALLNLSVSVKDSNAITMLDSLICQFPDAFQHFAGQFIGSLIEMWLNLVGTIEESDGSRLLSLIIRLIQRIPKNSQVLLDNSIYIAEFCCSALSECSSSFYITDFLDLLFCLIETIDIIPPTLFCLIPFLIKFISSNVEENVCFIEDITKILICLSQKSQFTDNLENIEKIITFGQLILGNCQQSNAISCIFYLLASVLQVVKQNVDQFAQFAICNILRLIENSVVDSTYLSSLYLLSTCLCVDSNLVILLLNETIISFVLNHFDVLNDVDYTKIKIMFLAFSILSRYDNFVFYQCAIAFLHTFSNNLMQIDENTGYISTDLTYHEEQFEILDISFPFDDENYENFVTELFENQVFFQQLPKEEQDFLQSMCHYDLTK